MFHEAAARILRSAAGLGMSFIAVVCAASAVAGGSDGWQDGTALTGGLSTVLPPPNNGKYITEGPPGNVHVVWKDDRDRNFEIYHRVRSGGVWGQARRVTFDGAPSARPVVASDAIGKVHLVWNDSRDGNKEIYHSMWDGYGWSGPHRVTFTGGDSFAPSSVATGYTLHIVYSEMTAGFFEIYYVNLDFAEWSEPLRLTAGATGDRLVPTIAAGPDGTVHVAWWDLGEGGSAGGSIYHMEGPGDWSGARLVSGPEADAMRPSVAVDDSGRVHVAWIDKRDGWEQIRLRTRGRDGIWGEEALLTSGDFTHYHPSLSMAGDELVLLYWADNPSISNSGCFVRRLAGGVWGGPVRISGGDSNSSLTCLYGKEDGTLYAGWVDGMGSVSAIYFNEYIPPGTGVGEDDEPEGELPPAALSVSVHPNPFDGETEIGIELPGNTEVTADLYDVSGRRVRRLCRRAMEGGGNAIRWDGRDGAGRAVSPGIYMLRVRAGKLSAVRKVVHWR